MGITLQDLDKVRPLFRDALMQPGPITVELHFEALPGKILLDLTRDGVSSHLVQVFSIPRDIARDGPGVCLYSSGIEGVSLDEDSLCFLVIEAVRSIAQKMN